jgi:hypothetical protein
VIVVSVIAVLLMGSGWVTSQVGEHKESVE